MKFNEYQMSRSFCDLGLIRNVWNIEIKFDMKAYGNTGIKIYANGPNHMTKMAAMPIHGKNI